MRHVTFSVFFFLVLLLPWVEWGDTPGGSDFVIPVLVSDGNGNPVTNLEAGDLHLFLGDGNMPVDFSLRRGDGGAGKLNVIILDSTVTEQSDFIAAKRATETFIKKGLQKQDGVLLQFAPLEGLRLLGRDKALMRELNFAVMYPGLKGKEYRGHISTRNYRGVDNARKSRHYRSAEIDRINFKRLLKKVQSAFRRDSFFEDQILRFSYFRTHLINSLRAVEQPKVVYLLAAERSKAPDSAGVTGDGTEKTPLHRQRGYDVFTRRQMELLKEAVDQSGSLLVTMPPKQARKEWLTKASGYYELVLPRQGVGEGSDIPVKVTTDRKDLRVIAPAFLVRPKPFRMLTPHQKWLAILDLVREEPLVELALRPEVVKFELKQLDPDGYELPGDQGEPLTETVELDLPAHMQGKKLEIYIVYVELKQRWVQVEARTIAGADSILRFRLKRPVYHDRIFVVMDPETSRCLYNIVEWDWGSVEK